MKPNTFPYSKQSEFLTLDIGSRILRNDPYKDCVKEADLAIFKEGNYFPVLAVEFGVTDDEQRLYDEAEKWLRGSHGVTKMVMLVHIGET